MKTFFVSVLAGVMLFPWVAGGSIGNIPLLHVETYNSPSGKWMLEVDPTDREGRGKGNYRMVSDGKEVWHGVHPFTLWDAAVTDDGVTVGFGYSHGKQGFGDGGPGFLNVVIIDAAGKARLNDAVKRKRSSYPHGLPEPGVSGFMLHAGQDRFIMELDSDEREIWRVYQLSTGRKLDVIDLRAASKAVDAEWHVMDAKPIAGLPLVLTRWWRDDDSENEGATFSILDFKGRRVWSLALPEDYTIHDEEPVKDRLRDGLRRTGAILETKEPGEFEIHHVASGERVRFRVVRDLATKTGWTAREISRAKYQPPPAVKPEPKPAADVPPLRFIDSFVLDDPPATDAIRDIAGFDIDGDGRFGFLRLAPLGGEHAFVLADQLGKVVAEIALPMTKDAYVHCAWLAASRWIITASESGKDRKTRAWWFDVEKKSLTEIEGFECPSVEVVRGSGDGGFVALATFHQKYSSTAFLICFDRLGKARWKHKEIGDDQPASLLSPEDIAVTSGEEIAVVDNIRDTVQIYDLEGVHLRTINLKKSWKREPNYPSGITPDADGGFIVHDFHGKPPFVRMKADGSVRGEFTPKYADGRVIDADKGVRAAPDGSLWACDGESFIQLSDQGAGLRIIGPAPDDDKLGDITAVIVDPRGNTYAVDQRTGAVHVFGPDGKRLRVCKPARDDFTEDLRGPHIAVSGDGGVMLEKEKFTGKSQYLCFASNGERLGFKNYDLDSISGEWYPQPGTSNMLVAGYEAAFLIDPQGKVLKKMDRQADRRWFDNPGGAAFVEDGSFVIHTSASDRAEIGVTFFTSDGVAQGTCTLEGGGFTRLGGYNGRLFSMGGSESVVVYDRSGKAIGITPRSAGYPDHFITRGGRELWLVNRTTRKVERYQLP